ncbi:MAG TPA: hypothetical protein VJO15_04190, partial [Dehalococcoidia bacterium]|nr:hypothetical protein [Dehalococcoidia bacterium]
TPWRTGPSATTSIWLVRHAVTDNGNPVGADLRVRPAAPWRTGPSATTRIWRIRHLVTDNGKHVVFLIAAEEVE